MALAERISDSDAVSVPRTQVGTIRCIPVATSEAQTEVIQSLRKDGFVVQLVRLGYAYVLHGGLDTPGGPDWLGEYNRPLSTADTARWSEMMQHLICEMRQKAAK